MFILVNPDTNVLIKISQICIPIINNKGENIECEEEKATAYIMDSLIYPKKIPCKMYEVDSIPEDVVPYKYIYTIKDGFIPNENYKKPEDIYTSLSNLENEIFIINSNINILDEDSVKTNTPKTLNTHLYLGSNNFWINGAGDEKINNLTVDGNSIFNNNATFKNNVYFGNSSYYINSSGNAKFNTIIIDSTSTFGGNITFKSNVYFANGTNYYINNTGTANLNVLTVNGGSTFIGNSTFRSHVYFANNTNYYINNAAVARLNSVTIVAGLSVGTTSTFGGNTTFKSHVYFANGTTYYISKAGAANLNTLAVNSTSVFGGESTFKNNVYFANNKNYYVNSAGTARFNLLTAASGLYIGVNGSTSAYSYLYHTLCFGSSGNYWVNQKGNARFNGVTFQGKVKFNNNCTLHDQFTFGSDESPNTGRPYYVNDFGNGSFYHSWVDILAYYKGGSASSRRFKENIEYRDNDYWHDRLMQVKPCTFNYKNHTKDDISIGVIAEDIIKIFPELVEFDENGECEMVRTPELISVLISEAQRSNSIIDNMKKEINNLKSIIEDLIQYS